MRFVVLGAGAIGGVVGSKLSAGGREVVFIARGAQLEAIRDRGLRLETPEGALTVRAPVVEHPARVDWRAEDVVLLAVKTQDAAAALRDLAAAAPAETPIACLTNGLETERLALRWFRRVLAVCVVCPATFVVPGVIQAWASPVAGTFDLGPVPEGRSPLAHALAEQLTEVGLSSNPLADILRWKRRKLLSNLANAIDALCGQSERGDEIAERARREGLACFAAASLPVVSEEQDMARREMLQMKTIQGRPRDGGSTWQSLARRTGAVECDYLNGEVVLLGRLWGVATPVNELLQRLVAQAARAGAAPGAFPIEALAGQLAM
ncbi:MAG: 2-dehydropantoate 2-reductase N-terminal domain-containing protein [Polyangiaceae bacterium]|jgi:2-dehydropantoate 2-reductase